VSRIRVISGRFGGQTLRVLAGEQTRPTTERVREAWASTVGSLLPEGFARLRVLDAFAGSGALGLEALSRGAAHVTFCERDRRALEVLRANRDALDGDHAVTTVLPADSFAPKTLGLLRRTGPYRLVILDPPYACAAGKILSLLRALAVSGSLDAGALISYEHARDPARDQARGPACDPARDPARDADEALETPETPETLERRPLCAACSPASLKMVSCKTYGTTQIDYLLYR
jgi:16S rRNA (guanine966-N2)-methyltransferase